MSKRHGSALSATSSESVGPEKSQFTPDPPQRTLEDVRYQVAFEVAVRTINKAETVDGKSRLFSINPASKTLTKA
jgi:hypothetical protein